MLNLILVLLLAGAQPPARGVAVSGVVQDQTTAVLPNAQVSIVASTGSVLQSGTTDPAGGVSFRSDCVQATTKFAPSFRVSRPAHESFALVPGRRRP